MLHFWHFENIRCTFAGLSEKIAIFILLNCFFPHLALIVGEPKLQFQNFFLCHIRQTPKSALDVPVATNLLCYFTEFFKVMLEQDIQKEEARGDRFICISATRQFIVLLKIHQHANDKINRCSIKITIENAKMFLNDKNWRKKLECSMKIYCLITQ